MPQLKDPHGTTKIPHATTKRSRRLQIKRLYMSQLVIPHHVTMISCHIKDPYAATKISQASTKNPCDTTKRSHVHSEKKLHNATKISHGPQIKIPHATTNDPCMLQKIQCHKFPRATTKDSADHNNKP